MKVSLNTVKQFTSVTLSNAELVKKLNEQLGKVEKTYDLAKKYRGIIIVKVMQADKHPDADKLTVCLVDDGGAVKDVERDPNGYVRVVCGAPNVHEGMFAIWLPPGVTVPSSFDDKEPFVLGKRELRGVLSNGMIAAADELAIGSDHEGIVELTKTDLPYTFEGDLRPGMDFAATFGLDDFVCDIENKMFTHRPDCFGNLGVAREIAGIQGITFHSPDWYQVTSYEPRATNPTDDLELKVTNDVREKVPRFMAVVVKNISVYKSPFWLQCELVRMGGKPLNNVVDVTNYIMLLTGQPMHAYDYDKLHGHTVGARLAKDGEKATLLNGKTYELTADDIVIVDGEGVVGLGGVMGSATSEVSATTKNIVLECATFDMYTIRKTSMRHGIFTDAVTRFNKGQSPLQNVPILRAALLSVIDLAGGEQASAMCDEPPQDEQKTSRNVMTSVDFINSRLGLTLTAEDVTRILENVEISCDVHDGSLTVTPPFWRTDLEIPEDIVEEVGRLYGLGSLPLELPRRSTVAVPEDERFRFGSQLRDIFSRAGANEVLSYSFVHESLMKKALQPTDEAFSLSNALSPDLEYFRYSPLASLLDKVHLNIKAGYDEFVLFELGKGHNKKHHADDDNGLPTELDYVDLVYASKRTGTGAPYFDVRRLLDEVAEKLHVTFVYTAIDTDPGYPITQPFDYTRSAMIATDAGDFVGMIGELKQSVLRHFKLPTRTAAATLDFVSLMKAAQHATVSYKPLSRFPKISQDISLRVKSDVTFADLHKAVTAVAANESSTNMRVEVEPLTIYSPASSAETRTYTFRLTLVHFEKTMTEAEASRVIAAVAAAAKEQCSAEQV